MEKLRMTSPDLTEANLEKLAELFPAVITETLDSEGNPQHGIDFDLLRQELSDHIVEGPQERYRLDWPGKRAAAFAANAPIAKTLRAVREESVEFDTTKNLFIEGDNLDALKLLQESYLGKVKLIYIDPPYNTGHDFVYEDDFAESRAEYLQRSGQQEESGERLVANPESNGRFHSDWLSMMYPRLKLARNLLAPDGIIFVSIDDNEASNLRRLMDEVFGSSNLFAELVVIRAEGGGLAKRVVKGHDCLIGYTRDASQFPGMFRQKDVRGEIVDMDGRAYWIETDWLRAEFGKYGTLAYEDIESVKGIKKKAEIDEGLSSGKYRLIPRGHKNIVGRLRALDEDGSKFYSVLKHLNKDAKESLIPIEMNGLFDNPKPIGLIEELIMGATRFAKSEEQIVMDFFAGSGTTAHAVMRANGHDGGNRRFILVQLDEAAAAGSPAARAGYTSIPQLTRERLRRAGDMESKSANEEASDFGFRSLHVDTSNMADVIRTPDATDQLALTDLEPSVKSDRTGEDLLFQVLLDWGLELAMPIVKETIFGHEVFDVEDGTLIACFDKSLGSEVVQQIARRNPVRVVFRDDGFESDAQRINVEQIFRELSPSTEVKAI